MLSLMLLIISDRNVDLLICDYSLFLGFHALPIYIRT